VLVKPGYSYLLVDIPARKAQTEQTLELGVACILGFQAFVNDLQDFHDQFSLSIQGKL
jgi:hypothetical protein